MTLAKFQPNRTTGSKVMAKKLKKGTFQEPGTRDKLPGSRVPGFCQLPGSYYPVPDKPTCDVGSLPQNRIEKSRRVKSEQIYGINLYKEETFVKKAPSKNVSKHFLMYVLYF